MKFPGYTWYAAILKSKNVFPVVFLANIEKRFAGIKAVSQNAYWKSGKGFLQLYLESPECISLAILLAYTSRFVFYEFCGNTHYNIVTKYKLCLQNIVIVSSFLFIIFLVLYGSSHAVLAVPFRKTENLCSVDDNTPVFSHKSCIFKGSFSYKSIYHFIFYILQLRWVEFL